MDASPTTAPGECRRFLDMPRAVVAALHLPDLSVARGTPMRRLIDYTLRNAEVFAEGGIPAMMLQDQTRVTGASPPEAVAVTAALGRLIRERFPGLHLGIIVEAHDPVAPLAVAHAAGASFVRLKVFVGRAVTASGMREGLGVDAISERHALRREDIAILADVHDRTAAPADGVDHVRAARWAADLGADALVLTGADEGDTVARLEAARQGGVRRPLFAGGGVHAGNIRRMLAAAHGVIVSRSLMRSDAAADDVVRWDLDRCRRLMAAVG